MIRGKLIVIDGADGSGKRTQAELLLKRLKKAKKKAVLISFPQYSQFFGKLVRCYLNGEFGKLNEVDAHLTSVLYAADRWQAKEKINDWLKKDYIVIADRYAESNMAHQTAKIFSPLKRKRFLKWLNDLEYGNFQIPRADMVLYLDVAVEIGQKLMDGRGKKDIHEADIDYLKKVQNQYRNFCKTRKNWHCVICAQNGKILSREQIAEKIWEVVGKKI
ncbi:MAG: dTMP kinase [Patescibacteria group bacterium]